jgi:hypothetical protein
MFEGFVFIVVFVLFTGSVSSSAALGVGSVRWPSPLGLGVAKSSVLTGFREHMILIMVQ